jgi:cell division protease FtsH
MLGTPATSSPYAREFSDETERLMDHAVRDLVGHAFDRAIEILNAHRAVHEKTAQLLLQQETLEEKDIAALRAQIVPAAGATDAMADKPVAAVRLPVALE